MYIDTHCHISKKEYDVKLLAKELKENIIFISGSDKESNLEVLDLSSEYKNFRGLIGYHPLDVDNLEDKDLEILEQQIINNKIIGIGEIGLDYYYRKDNKEKQIYFFKKQIELARKYNLPIVVHIRESIQDAYDILKEEKNLKIVVHMFSGSVEMANNFIKLGAKLGVGGVVTFKNSKNIKLIVENIDLKYILLETDCPYISPEPFRGQLNTPLNIPIIAEKIAELKQVTKEEVFLVTTQNAIEQFDLKDIL
ncbi:MAG: TatD family hydrolase [Mycoplasmatota bacterium]